MPIRIHHIGVAVADLDASIRVYTSALGAELVHRATNEKEGLEAAFMRVGDGEIELMSPLRDDSPVGKFMAKRGPGLHHVAYGVADIDESLDTEEAKQSLHQRRHRSPPVRSVFQDGPEPGCELCITQADCGFESPFCHK